MKFTLPMPPGINRTYGIRGINLKINGKYNIPSTKMYKKQIVRDWENEAGFAILVQWKGRHAPLAGKLEMGIDWFINHERDIDAGLKVLLDVFAKQRVYLNDSQIKRITHIDIKEDKENPRVEVEIEEYEGGE